MAIVDRARVAVESLPREVVYVGFSLGVLPAQSLAQTRPHARGAVLCYSALPLGQWGDNWPATWPAGVRLQLHILEADEDYEIAQGLATTVPGAELFVYPGTEHLFAEHDEQAAARHSHVSSVTWTAQSLARGTPGSRLPRRRLKQHCRSRCRQRDRGHPSR